MTEWRYALPLIAGLVTFVLLRWMLSGRNAQWALDHPNHRSLHQAPVPRTGGIGVMAGVMVAWIALGIPVLLGGAMLLAMMSLADDIRGLSVRWRFLGHFCVASIMVWWIPLAVPVFVAVLLVIALVWMINLYNFMDGSDGLAGGMALFGFGAYAVVAWLAGDVQLALASAAIAGSACAFLIYNFHPARIFMGDAGSVPLGFLAGAMGLMGWQRGLWSWWFPVMVFSPFIVDATVTLLKRLLRGEKIWQAHRSHYYQRLVQLGWGHRNTALAEYFLMLNAAIWAIVALKSPPDGQWGTGLGCLMVYGILAVWIDRRWAEMQKTT